jgi:hypothetical protein
MRILYFFLLFLLIAYGCKKPDTEPNNNCTPEKREYTFEANKQIDHQRVPRPDTTFEYYTYSVKGGDKIVFTYTWQYQDCPQIADDEGKRTIIFELPAGINSFQLTDSTALRTAKALVTYSCLCYPGGTVLIKNGSIEGHREADNRWQIKASLKIARTGSIDFDQSFTKK